MPKDSADGRKYRPQTNLVRGGLDRSHFDELAEAMYLSSSYAYASAEQAQRAFKGEEDHYLYSRYGNPTVTVVRGAPRAVGGRRDLPIHRVRHGRHVRLPGLHVEGRRPAGGVQGAVRVVRLRLYGAAAPATGWRR